MNGIQVKKYVEKQDEEGDKALQNNPAKAQKIMTKRRVLRITFVFLFILFCLLFLFSCLAFGMLAVYSNRGQIILPSWWGPYLVIIILFLIYIISVFLSRVIGNFLVWFVISSVFSGILFFTLMDVYNKLNQSVVDFDIISISSAQTIDKFLPIYFVSLVLAVIVYIPAKFLKKRIKKPIFKYTRVN